MNQDFGDSFGREKIPSYNQRNKVTHITMTTDDNMVNNNATECSVSPDCTSSHYWAPENCKQIMSIFATHKTMSFAFC